MSLLHYENGLDTFSEASTTQTITVSHDTDESAYLTLVFDENVDLETLKSTLTVTGPDSARIELVWPDGDNLDYVIQDGEALKNDDGNAINVLTDVVERSDDSG